MTAVWLELMVSECFM